MSGILVIFQRDGRPVEKNLPERMLAACPERAVDGEDIWIDGATALGHQHFWVTPEERGERQPLVDPISGCALTADVRLDNREELGRALGMDAIESGEQSDAALILRSYHRWGVDCIKYFLGDFAFVLWDPNHRQIFAGRDALGARNLCYYADQRNFLAASQVSMIVAHPDVLRRINADRIAEYLAVIYSDHENTFFQDIFYCPPAHWLLVTADRLRAERYWEIDPAMRIRYGKDEDYAEQLRSLLQEAVRCRMRTDGLVGISLSGGLDSSCLAGLSAETLAENQAGQKRLKSFSYVFDEFGDCDERRYIQPLAKQQGIEAKFILGDGKWTLRHAGYMPVLFETPSFDIYYWLARLTLRAAARAGCRVFLTGQYGDEMFDTWENWAAAMWLDRRFADFFKVIRSNPYRTRLWSEIINQGIRPLIPQRLKKYYRRLRPRQPDWLDYGLHPRLEERLRTREAQQRADCVQARFRTYHQAVMYNRLFNLGSVEGLAQYQGVGNWDGIEMVHPYADRRLVEFVMAIPADQIGLPDRSRRIQRNIMLGAAPESIIERVDKTEFTPLFINGIMEREKTRFWPVFSDALIVEHEYVNRDWLEQLLRSQSLGPKEGYALWQYFTLERWLRCYWQ